MWHIADMRKSALVLLAIIVAGCSRADVETLGRIGLRVEKKVSVVWNSEANHRLMKSLPLLQPPEGPAPNPNDDSGKPMAPRLNVE